MSVNTEAHINDALGVMKPLHCATLMHTSRELAVLKASPPARPTGALCATKIYHQERRDGRSTYWQLLDALGTNAQLTFEVNI